LVPPLIVPLLSTPSAFLRACFNTAFWFFSCAVGLLKCTPPRPKVGFPPRPLLSPMPAAPSPGPPPRAFTLLQRITQWQQHAHLQPYLPASSSSAQALGLAHLHAAAPPSPGAPLCPSPGPRSSSRGGTAQPRGAPALFRTAHCTPLPAEVALSSVSLLPLPRPLKAHGCSPFNRCHHRRCRSAQPRGRVLSSPAANSARSGCTAASPCGALRCGFAKPRCANALFRSARPSHWQQLSYRQPYFRCLALFQPMVVLLRAAHCPTLSPPVATIARFALSSASLFLAHRPQTTRRRPAKGRLAQALLCKPLSVF